MRDLLVNSISIHLILFFQGCTAKLNAAGFQKKISQRSLEKTFFSLQIYQPFGIIIAVFNRCMTEKIDNAFVLVFICASQLTSKKIRENFLRKAEKKKMLCAGEKNVRRSEAPGLARSPVLVQKIEF